MTGITEDMAKAIDSAYEAGVTTVWTHEGYHYELKGRQEDTNSGYLLFSNDRLDEMPIGIEIFDIIVSCNKMYLSAYGFEIALEMEASE